MPVTIKDIAGKAGVTPVTVSRALNDKPDISSATKENILKIADDLGYVPNYLAKSLVTRETKTVGILIPNTVDPFYAEVVQGINDLARERGYSIILCNTHNDADEELKFIRHLREKRADGMLIYPVQEDNRYIEELKKNPIPFVFLNRHSDELQSDYVINDNIVGAFSAVNHLIEKGHKNIIYICSKPSASSAQERIEGCKKAIEKNNLPSDSIRIILCKESIESCYNLVKKIIRKDKDRKALFVWDDKMAVGAIKAILEEGLKIPEDIALVGYDDIEISEYLYPPLTTVRQPTYQIGKKAAQILLEKLESKDKVKTKHIVLKPKLIFRKTT